ncbi:MAG TPA: peptide-methionine (S)-S-oxide reductase MsrA [Verrucomicrobiota bacterium]|nr:peptide-methionine (S)-S-oxide reductase MsrA [Verrucomicrobiota bacterium]
MNAQPTSPIASASEYATLGGGCFWCIEAVFERVPGVKSVVSGYAGGHTEKPTYKAVCAGDTGHAEVVQIQFDPRTITYEQVLDLFWQAHDPTTLNRQGPDVGTQYRSVIFYHDESQRVAAEKSKAGAGKQFARPIVTEIQALPRFYRAEGYHQDYYRNNPNQPYCRMIIRPKLDKLKKGL